MRYSRQGGYGTPSLPVLLDLNGTQKRYGGVTALRDGILPPTANFNQPDPECDLDVIPNQAREAQVEYALSNSFAFGGLNAVLALRKG